MIFLGLTGFLLALLSLSGQLLKYLTDYDQAFGLIPLVYMGKALSIPTIFTVLLIFVIALVLCVITVREFIGADKFRWQWWGLSAFFLFFTLDKGSAVHTYLFKQFRNLMRVFFPAYPNQKWVTTIVIIALIVICFYPKFIAALSKRTKTLALVSAAVYYAGFLFIDRFAHDYAALYSAETLGYSILVTIGKMLEILGLIACLNTLLDYQKADISEVTLDISQKGKMRRAA